MTVVSVWMGHDSVTCDKTHSYGIWLIRNWHDSLSKYWCAKTTWWMSHVTYEWVMSHMSESCPIWMRVMSHMNESCHMWHNFLVHRYMWDMIHSHVTWLIHRGHDSFIRDMTRCLLQGGDDALDAVTCRSLSAREPIIIGFFCGKRPEKIRHAIPLPTCTHPL